MTIALYFNPVIEPADGLHYVVASHERILAGCDTPAEAETARLAFERVLLPRFTADEAIEQLKATENHEMTACFSEDIRDAYMAGARWALEALAAAGVFVPGEPKACEACAGRKKIGTERPGYMREYHDCPDCNGTGRVHQTMADKLDAAGIK